MQLHVRDAEVTVTRGKKSEKREGNAIEVAKELLTAHKPAAAPTLPPFTGGAVGFCAYDMVRQLENIGNSAKDDLQLPDCTLLFFDRLLAFDPLRHQVHIIASADVSNESPRKAYDRAVADIAILEKKLARGPKPGEWQKSSAKARGKLKVRPRVTREQFEQSVRR